MSLRIQAVVLCYDRSWNQFYLHDGHEAAWISPQNFQGAFEPGQFVELHGKTAVSGGAPIWTNLSLTLLGKKTLPAPAKLKLSDFKEMPGQWIETEGLVRVAEKSQGPLCLVLHDGTQNALIYVFGEKATDQTRRWLGCRVRVRGINSSKVEDGRLISAGMMVPSPQQIQVVVPAAADPLKEPVQSIDALTSRELDSWTNNVVHLNGIVTSYAPGELVSLKDPTGAIRARVIQINPVEAGTRVDVWGFLAIEDSEPVLRDAWFQAAAAAKPSASEAIPSPARVLAPARTLTLVSQIRELTPEEITQHLPVRFRGVVTFVDPDWRGAFLQDSSGGVFFEPERTDFAPGQWVELTGEVGPGGFLPQVVDGGVQILCPTNLPAPVHAQPQDLVSGQWDASWVELNGVVRKVTLSGRHIWLDLVSARGNFRAVLSQPEATSAPENLLDSRVSVQGACACELNDRRQISGIVLHVPDFKYVTVAEEAPLDPYSVRATPIRAVAAFHPGAVAPRRIKVRGSVSSLLPGQGFYVQDDSGGIRVVTQQTNQVRLGDILEVLGFPALGDFSPYLSDANFRQVGTGSPARPRVVNAEEILATGEVDGVRVSLDASLLQPVSQSARPKLILQSGPFIFTASVVQPDVTHELAGLVPGSLLRLSGVCAVQGGENHEPSSFRILVDRAGDVQMLKAPPVWSLRHTFIIAGALGALTLLTLAWVGMLRHQVRVQTDVIRKEKNLLSTLIDHLPENVFVKDTDGRYILTNRSHTRFHGAASAGELIGKHTDEVCPSDLAHTYSETDRKILSGALDSFEAEEPARNSRGELRCLSTIKVPLQDDTGRIVGLVGISRDVTERKRAEEALKASEQFTRSLVEHLPQNILHKDMEGRFTFVNDFFCKTIDRSMDQILGKTDFDLYPPELARKFREDDQRVIASGVHLRVVEENRNVAGERTYVEVIKSPLWGGDGRPAGLQVIFWDVTPQKQAEAQLAYERDLLKALLDHYPDAIYFKDLQSRFVRVSKSKLERSFAVACSRYAADHPDSNGALPQHLRSLEAFEPFVTGKTDFDFFEPARAQAAFDDEQEIIRTGQPLIGKVEKAILPDGKAYWSLSTKMPWLDQNGRIIGTFGISKDITSIKEAESTLAAVHRQLVETSRRAGMAEVATRVLHNVGNVLNSVNVSATLLSDKLRQSKAGSLSKAVALMREHGAELGRFITEDPRGRQIPGYLEQLAERLVQEQSFLTAEISALSKNIEHIKQIVTMQQSYAKVAGVTEVVPTADLIEEALRINADCLAEARIEVRREYDSDALPEITVEKHKVLQILVNLLRNAGFACEESSRPDKAISVHAENGSDRVKISIRDNGVGIAPENMTRIFNLGFTTRKNGHGFGLHSGALAAKELGGALRAHSEGQGLGATFVLELPLDPPKNYA